MYYFTAEQFAQIEAAAENSTSGYPYADRYAKIFEIIQQPDAFGNLAPSNVIAWFGAAAQANRGVGGASDFIRDYTQIQLEIRTGAAVSDIETVLQNASNAIAVEVFDDISTNDQTIDGQTYYALPTAHEIGVNDAIQAMATLSAFDSDPGIWSGNPLFLGLGDASFWNQNIINDDENTYDLFVTRVAFTEAGFALNASGMSDLSNLFFGQGFGSFLTNATTISGAYADSLDFIGTAYGGMANSVFGSNPALLVFADMVIGSTGNDTGLVPDYSPLHHDNDFIHGGAGNDTIFATLGRDMIDGGSGSDTVSFELLDTISSRVILNNHNSAVPFSASIVVGDEGNNDTTVLFDVEDLVLGSGDDILEVHSLTYLNTIDAGGQTEGGGDTINATNATASVDVDLTLNTLELGSSGIQVTNFENVVGSNYNDTITGNDSTNILYGGGGADSLSGGAGDDILIFDADDTLVDGGAGRDVGIVSGEAGVTVDLAATGLEVVVGGAGSDNFALNGQGDTLQMAAGGRGVDTFTIDSTGETLSSSGPVVVWGGEGADIFNINDSDNEDYSHGILTVNVEGLTVDNFADFNLEMLDLGANFNWDAIDMVVLNSDSEDQFFINGERIGVEAGNVQVSQRDSEGIIRFIGTQDMDLRFGADRDEAVGVFDATFLSDGTISVQTSVRVRSHESIMQAINPDTDEIWEWEDFGFDDISWDDFDLHTADFIQSFDFYSGPFDLGTEYESIGYYWIRFESEGHTVESLSGVGPLTDIDWLSSPWFVVGGEFDNLNLSANGSISVTMPEDETGFSVTDWLASVSGDIGGDGGTGGGGGGTPPPNNPNTNSGSGPTTFTSFSTETSSLTFNGTATDPNDTTAGYSLAQVGANVEVDFGGGDVVTLENVSLTEWQAAATTQFFGSAAGEILTGTSQGEVFSAGAGDDLIIAGSGDDTINYVAGDDVIKGKKSNYGNDTLDLSQYTADQVSFRIVGHDVFIDTPDGTIELDYQVRYEVGHARTNIENIIFSDGTLDDAGIRDRAIADQTSAGDDIVTGSFQADTISTGAGNDTIYAGSGDDMIIYTSGDDVIIGNNTGYNYGNDTLDLSQYTADQVNFRIVGHDVFIDTPDGSIELDYQVRNELGDARLNIENIIFSDGTLDEVGIAARAIADQASSGGDMITGSYQSEVITGGAGNDTLSGVSGSDTFVFAVGDGVDVITDYDATNDALEFIGINFSDLTIIQTGNDVLIEYGTGDQVLITGAGIDMFNEPEFLFV